MFNYNGVYKFNSAIDELIDEDTRDFIVRKLKYVDSNYSEEDACIGLMYETMPTAGISGRLLNFMVIVKCLRSENPKDMLAVAIAMSREGAYYRPQAIEYFEKYFKSNCKLPFMPGNCYRGENDDEYQSRSLFSDWFLHSELSRLYEQEYKFDKAVEQLEECIKYAKGGNPADFTRIGDILIKIGTQNAKQYYDKLFKSKYYEIHQRTFDHAYEKLEEKIASGYAYKPRKNKKPPQLSDHQLLALGAAPCLI